MAVQLVFVGPGRKPGDRSSRDEAHLSSILLIVCRFLVANMAKEGTFDVSPAWHPFYGT